MKKFILAIVLALVAFPAQAAFKGALVYKAGSDQSIPNGIQTMTTFNTEVYDTDGFFDASTSATRFVIPEGVTAVRMACQHIWYNNANGIRQIVLKKNYPANNGYGVGGWYPGNPAVTLGANGATTTDPHVYTGVIPVQAGDFFECEAYQNSGVGLNLLASVGTWFFIEAVDLDVTPPPPPTYGAQVFSKTMNTDANGWNNDTLRGIVKRSDLSNVPTSPTKMYVTLQGCAAEGFATNGAYIGFKSGTYGFSSSAQLKTVSGDLTSFTVPAGGDVQLYANLPDDGVSDIMVSFQNSNTASDCIKVGHPENGFKSYYKDGANNDASNASPSGYGDFGGSDANNKHVFVKELRFE